MMLKEILQIFLNKVIKEKLRSTFKNVAISILPIILLLIFCTSTIPRTESSDISEDTFRPFDQDDITSYFPAAHYHKLFYTPICTLTNDIIESVRQKLELYEETIQAFPSRTSMNKNCSFNDHYFFAVDFKDICTQNNTLRKNKLNYTIITKNNKFRTGEQYAKNYITAYNRDTNEYIDSGFAALQFVLDSIFIKTEIPNTRDRDFKLTIKHMPLPRERPDKNSRILIALFSGVFTILQLLFLILSPLIQEKECGFNEYLKNVTKYHNLNNICIFCINYAIILISLFIQLIILYYYGVFEYITPIYPIILIILYLFAQVSFTFFISSLFHKEIYASIISPGIYFVPYFLKNAVHQGEWLESVLMIFPINSYAKVLDIFDSYANTGHKFDSVINLCNRKYPGLEEFSVLSLFLIQFFSGCLFLVFYNYINSIYPGNYGTPKSWYYPYKYIDRLIQSIRTRMGSPKTGVFNEEISLNTNTTEITTVDKNKDVVLKTTALCKTFDGKKAVDNVNLTIYRNEITVLLGHNGAGKSTTLNMLTGMISKTSGEIVVDGESDIDAYRTCIGFCPQHNILLSYLTCIEHLELFGRLRGLSVEEATRKAEEILEKTCMSDKGREYAVNLSGGMKRKLCMGNALIGNTKVLILDEPSSGLDPEARRDIWNILLKLKQDHTILLTTHAMEEAEILGDKIAIMNDGQVKDFGSSMELKEKYEIGYTIKLLKADNFQKKEIINIFQKHGINDYKIKDTVNTMFCVIIQYRHVDRISNLLRDIEVRRTRFGIETISVSNGSLEDVFLKSNNDIKIEKTEINPAQSENASIAVPDQEIERVPAMNILYAIWYKKQAYIRHNKLLFGIMCFAPVLLVILTLITSFTTTKELESLNLNLMLPIEKMKVHINFNPESIKRKFLNVGVTKFKYDAVHYEVSDNEDLEKILKEAANAMPLEYTDRVLFGMDVSEVNGELNIKCFFSNNLLHSLPVCMNLASTYFAMYYGQTDDSDIAISNSPLLRFDAKDYESLKYYTDLLPTGIFIFMLFFLMQPFAEYCSEFKKLENIPKHQYWGFTFLIDAIVHTLVCASIVFITVIVMKSGLFATSDYFLLLTVLMLYGFVNIVQTYIVSQCFRDLGNCISFLSYAMITSVFAVMLMSSSIESMTKYSSEIWALNFLLPFFSFQHALKILFEEKRLEIERMGEKQQGEEMLSYAPYFIAMPIVFMVSSLILIYIVDNPRSRNTFTTRLGRLLTGKKTNAGPKIDIDDNITRDADKIGKLIEEKHYSEHSLIVSHLQKSFYRLRRPPVEAVKDLSFAIKNDGECFGLLGLNGAGKSTTFKILTSGEIQDNGIVLINGRLPSPTSGCGYCPQVDALNECMTGFELLNYIALLRGIPRGESKTTVENWFKDLQILEYMNAPVRTYSGGTKRKLNTAIAMINEPKLIFLDEPTTGVDPVARRYVWKAIQKYQHGLKSVILTSHSMDECEALCHRLAIMHNGMFKCIGPIPFLKNKYGKGFSLCVEKVKDFRTDDVTDSTLTISSVVPAASSNNDRTEAEINRVYDSKAELLNKNEDYLHYFVRKENIKWSEIFEVLNKLKSEGFLKNYAINETTLEDIFLSFR